MSEDQTLSMVVVRSHTYDLISSIQWNALFASRLHWMTFTPFLAPDAETMIGGFTPHVSGRVIRTCFISVAELGFPSGETWLTVVNKAKAVGMKLCSEAGICSLVLTVKDDRSVFPPGTRVLIATEPYQVGTSLIFLEATRCRYGDEAFRVEAAPVAFRQWLLPDMKLAFELK